MIIIMANTGKYGSSNSEWLIMANTDWLTMMVNGDGYAQRWLIRGDGDSVNLWPIS